jgi:HK97 family phage major capsid protein
MSDELKNVEFLREMKQAVDGIREKAEKYGTESAEFKSYQEKAEKALDKLEKANEEVNTKIAKEAKEAEELKDRIKHLEMISSTSGVNQETKKNAHYLMDKLLRKQWLSVCENEPALAHAYMKSFYHINSGNFLNFPGEAKQFESLIQEYKATANLVRTDISEFGGYLVDIEWSNEIRKQIIEFTPARKYCRVKQIGGKTLMQPIRQGVATALWTGEAESGSASISNYTNEEITPYRLTNTVPVTWDQLQDSKYNISEEIMADNALAFAQAEGLAIVKGNGVKKPFGFTQDTNVPIYTTQTSTLNFDDIIGVTGALKLGYNPMYFFNRRTMAYIRTLKDLNDRYLWSGPFGDAASAAGATINGYRYSAEFIDMDDYNTATGTPILFADMFSFYQLTDRSDMVLIRDEYTRKKEAIVEFTLMRWTTGQAVVKEAGINVVLHS